MGVSCNLSSPQIKLCKACPGHVSFVRPNEPVLQTHTFARQPLKGRIPLSLPPWSVWEGVLLELQNPSRSPAPFRTPGSIPGTIKPTNSKESELHPQNVSSNLACLPPPAPCCSGEVLGVLPPLSFGNHRHSSGQQQGRGSPAGL